MAKDGTGWKDIPIGGMIVEAGNAVEYPTGDWRAFRPILDAERCVHCLQCWIMCPDSCIIVEDGKMKGFELLHCKGCGICAAVCPDKVKCITMIEEGKALEMEAK
jgi:2-oxoacid:acceptor oxidoreductase delta subunit (pyruvate/2-ketoisovalerate family)